MGFRVGKLTQITRAWHYSGRRFRENFVKKVSLVHSRYRVVKWDICQTWDLNPLCEFPGGGWWISGCGEDRVMHLSAFTSTLISGLFSLHTPIHWLTIELLQNSSVEEAEELQSDWIRKATGSVLNWC